jgi:hypothetical protein
MMKAFTIAVASVFLCAAAVPLAQADEPSAPFHVRKDRIDSSHVLITWEQDSTNEQGFEILRSLNEPDAEFESRGTVGANVTEFLDEAPRGPIFIYKVRAFNDDGDSGLSNMCYVNRPGPATPLYFIARLIALTVVRTEWSDRSNGERGFELQRAKLNKGFKTIARLPANTEFYEDYTLKPATTYTYRVRALGRPGICWDDGGFTVERTITTKGGVRILQVELRGRGKGSVTSEPERISCSPSDDHCTAEFPLARDVTLTAKAAKGSRFAGWADINACADTKGPCTVNMSKDRVVGAVFKLD